MKKLIAFIMSVCAIAASAAENVTIIYAWSPADPMANYARSMAQEANKMQDKYVFLVDTKPGAGNTIAANYVKATPNTILFTSSAFWIRPELYPNESYNTSDFKQFMPFCTGPVAISSIKYKSWDEVPKDKPLNIGVSGLGVTTHLISLQLVDKYPQLQPIPFKSAADSFLGMISGNLDFTVGFISEADAWAKDKSTKVQSHVLGITGPKTIHTYKPLASSGFNSVLKLLDVPHNMVVPVSTPDAKVKEWRSILVKAVQTKPVLDTFKSDMCEPLVLKDSEQDAWFTEQHQKWKRLATGVKLQ